MIYTNIDVFAERVKNKFTGKKIRDPAGIQLGFEPKNPSWMLDLIYFSLSQQKYQLFMSTYCH